jgi:hypothetical protein
LGNCNLARKRAILKARAKPPFTFGDIALNVVSIVLAGFSATFAWYMVMYGPSDGQDGAQAVTVALEPFETTRTKTGTHDMLDPIVTGSITKTDGSGKAASRGVADLLEKDQHLRYNLRTVFEDTAFVDVTNGRSVTTVPVERGAQLPGIGKVLRFEKREDKWVVVTSSAEISAEGMVTLREPE